MESPEGSYATHAEYSYAPVHNFCSIQCLFIWYPKLLIMSDSEEWASASDSEPQDTEPQVSSKKSSIHSHSQTDAEVANKETVSDASRVELEVEDKLVEADKDADPKLNPELCESDFKTSTTLDRIENITNDESPLLSTNALPTYDENKLLSQELSPPKELLTENLQKVNISRSDRQDLPTSHERGAVASKSDPSSSAWGDWGSSWLSMAATSVASSAHNLANTTEHGLSSILSSVESSFGIPTAESMATQDSGGKKGDESSAALDLKEIAQRLREEQNSETPASPPNSQPPSAPSSSEIAPIQNQNQTSQLPNADPKNDSTVKLSSVEDKQLPPGDSASFFGSYGVSFTSKIVSGGLDTLENLGKKTMDFLSEGDPGLRNKRTYVQDQIHSITNEISSVVVAEKEGEVTDSESLTSFHAEFEKLQGYVYLEALEILSSECEAKHHLKMHSISARREEGASNDVTLLKESFEIGFDTESAGCQWDDLFPSGKGTVGLERLNSAVREIDQCCDQFDSIGTAREVLLPHLNLSMQLLAKLSSLFVQTVRKVSELCLTQQLRVVEALPHTRQLALLAYKAIDRITTRIALVEVSDDVIGNKFILDMNSAVSYIQDSFSLIRPVLVHANSI